MTSFQPSTSSARQNNDGAALWALVAGEYSGTIRDALRREGFTAFSCDLIPSEEPGAHLQRNWREVIPLRRWNLIIFHPVCTEMSLSGNGTYGTGKPKHAARLAALRSAEADWDLVCEHSDHAALENPTSVIWTQSSIGPADQYIQPHEYGHGETKKTGLKLYNLPKLIPTNHVAGREQRVWKMAPGPDRAKERARTYPGWANAMAAQWGNYVREASQERLAA